MESGDDSGLQAPFQRLFRKFSDAGRENNSSREGSPKSGSSKPTEKVQGKPDNESETVKAKSNDKSKPVEKEGETAPKDPLGNVERTEKDFKAIQDTLDSLGPSAATAQEIETQVKHFTEGVPLLVKILDECAQLHPYISVAVLAFRAALALEMKRRSNDEKVQALFLEMKDTMNVLRLLVDIHDAETILSDGTSIESRLTVLCEKTADDIRSCSNVCDTYSRKGLVVKCIMAPVWDIRLAEFVTLFTDRRKEFLFAMDLRTTRNVEEIRNRMSAMQDSVKKTNERTELLLLVFQSIVSPQQKEIQTYIKDHGGPDKVRNSDKALSQIIKRVNRFSEEEDEISISTTAVDSATQAEDDDDETNSNHKKSGARKVLTVESLRLELADSFETSLTKNMEVFQGKFDVQKREIDIEIRKAMSRESQSIVKAIEEGFGRGPHVKVKDPDMRTLWENMGWKSSVKSKHFVHAVRDYYFEKVEAYKYHLIREEPDNLDFSDGWAMRYLNINFLKTLYEAIDDDTSGYITIEELNRFTNARPLNWSLIKWLAFWSFGLNRSMVERRKEIKKSFNDMFSLIPILLPQNQVHARKYLSEIWMGIASVTRSFKGKWSKWGSVDQFNDYVQAEEDRITRNFVDIKYKIDEENTVHLVAGPGRIEKYFFTLVKLLLERHLKIFHIARTKTLHPKELADASHSLGFVIAAFRSRLSDLKAICLNQTINQNKFLKRFAYGMFEYTHTHSTWKLEKILDFSYDASVYDAEESVDESTLSGVLSYGEGQTETVDVSFYEHNYSNPQPKPTSEVNQQTHPITGTWYALYYNSTSDIDPIECFFEMTFVAAAVQEDGSSFAFTAEGSKHDGRRWELTGSCQPNNELGDAIFAVSWQRSYQPAKLDDEYFSGDLDTQFMTISGRSGPQSGTKKQKHPVYFSRQPAGVLVRGPHPEALRGEQKYTALWRFALDATLHQVRRRQWSWSYFRDRRDTRNTYLELKLRRDGQLYPLTDQETHDLLLTQRKLFPADVLYLSSVLRVRLNSQVHAGFCCESCGIALLKDRIICMDCIAKPLPFEQLDLCNKKECFLKKFKRRRKRGRHELSHRVFKVRRFLLFRHLGPVWKKVKESIKGGDKALVDALASYKARPTATEMVAKDNGKTKITDQPAKSSATEPMDGGIRPAVSGMEVASSLSGSSPASKGNGTPHKSDDKGEKQPLTIKPTPLSGTRTSRPYQTPRTGRKMADPPSRSLCYYCGDKLESPCWGCVDCKANVLICVKCDHEGGFDQLLHKKDHTLLLVRAEPEDEGASDANAQILKAVRQLKSDFDARTSHLEATLGTLTERVQRLDGILNERVQSMDQQYSRLQQLLEQLVVNRSDLLAQPKS